MYFNCLRSNSSKCDVLMTILSSERCLSLYYGSRVPSEGEYFLLYCFQGSYKILDTFKNHKLQSNSVCPVGVAKQKPRLLQGKHTRRQN